MRWRHRTAAVSYTHLDVYKRQLYTLHVGAEVVQFVAVSMGNPHAVIEVDDVASADVLLIGPLMQTSAAFPQSANIGFAQVLSPTQIRLRVLERGGGDIGPLSFIHV